MSAPDLEEKKTEEEDEKLYVSRSLSALGRCQEKHHGPTTIIAALRTAVRERDILKGRQIHEELMGTGLVEKDVFVGTSVVNMYAKCGALTKARDVLERLPSRNLITWNTLLAGYAQHGYAKEVFQCVGKIKAEGFAPNSVTYLCVLKSCIATKSLGWGQEIHSEIAAEGLLERNAALSNALMDMYAKFGLLNKAQEVFDKLRNQDVISWNALILGYAHHGHGEEALILFEKMQNGGFVPNAITFLNILKACVGLRDLEKGREVHAHIIKYGLLQNNIVTGTALMHMYAKCGSLAEAIELFGGLPERNLICWTALITGYVHNGHFHEAIELFRKMQLIGYCPNSVTFICVLKACGSLRLSDEGLRLHCQIVKVGFSEGNLILGTALVDMYSNCSMLLDAQNVFDRFDDPDIPFWNALIAGYTEHSLSEESLNCLEQMRLGGLVPDAVTMICILKASASLGAAHRGQQLHTEIAKRHFLESKIIGSALVDMYSNCAMLQEAQYVFDRMAVLEIAVWNVLIAGYAHLGHEHGVFLLYFKMQSMGIYPDETTFTALFKLCSHTGLFEEAHFCFETMERDLRISPIEEHYACCIDLFGRAGCLEKGIVVIKMMPFHTCRITWQIVLTACQNLGYVKLGSLAFKQAVCINGKNGAAYVSMGNLHAAVMQ